MNREEMNWLLRTIQGSESAKRFVLAQYERGRISFRVMADVAPKADWMSCTAGQLLTTATDHVARALETPPVGIGERGARLLSPRSAMRSCGNREKS